ncbi:MAG: hypothetical protein AB1397_02595, partial [bacterium]
KRDNKGDYKGEKKGEKEKEKKRVHFLAILLQKRMLENNPKAKITLSQLQEWSKEVDLMIKMDKRSENEIRQVIEWSQKDTFWHKNILSMKAVRKQFDRLWLEIEKPMRNKSKYTAEVDSLLEELKKKEKIIEGETAKVEIVDDS